MKQHLKLDTIAKPVADHMHDFTGYMRQQMRSRTALLDTVIRYILRQQGKRVRPMLVFMAAGMCGAIDDRTYIGASMVELLHTATLVHDDVVDSAEERRGMASINALWKNKVAVLVGDFLLSKGLLIAVQNKEHDFLYVTSEAVRRMSEGELLQLQKKRQKTLDEETYFRIISDKTASLISTCCEIGALSASNDPQVRETLRNYGELVGLAFQIRDDVLDYESKSSILGKPVGNDIRDQKITLPLLMACANAEPSEGKKMVKVVKRGKHTNADVKMVIDFVIRNRGIEQSQQRAQDLSNQAIALLAPFKDSVYKEGLTDFAHFVVHRSK